MKPWLELVKLRITVASTVTTFVGYVMARGRIEPHDMTIPVGDGTIDGAAETMLAILEPRTDPDDPSDAQRVHDLLAEAFAPLVVDGQVQVEAAAWLVTAVR